jgi:SAM-dependent methyltransferase
MKVLDMGCGTCHIIRELAVRDSRVLFVGLDISPAMLRAAAGLAAMQTNIVLVEADGLSLPMGDRTFDIALTRLAEYSPREAHRILKQEGRLFVYGLGPNADREIAEFFPGRIVRENFFLPENRARWKEEERREIEEAGFVVSDMADYEEKQYYSDDEEVMDLIEMVPLVEGFDREEDGALIRQIQNKYGDEHGIAITWHYYVAEAHRP